MKPYILITNDDGFDAKGILVLTRLMLQLGEVIVVAPDGPRSGQSNAITVNHPIRYRLLEKSTDLKIYSCTGTPTDCVKLAMNEIVERTPDLIVSGINHGSNASVNILYSGTMGAAIEGCLAGIPSIGLSLCDHSSEADFSFFESHILKIAGEVLKNSLPHGVCLNVNAPQGNLTGVKIVRQCDGHWIKEFAGRTDPAGRKYFWLTGEYFNHESEAQDSDEWALSHGYVSVVPITVDMTAHQMINEMTKWEL